MSTETKKAGRPMTPRTKQIRATVTPARHAAIHDKASELGESLTGVINIALDMMGVTK